MQILTLFGTLYIAKHSSDKLCLYVAIITILKLGLRWRSQAAVCAVSTVNIVGL